MKQRMFQIKNSSLCVSYMSNDNKPFLREDFCTFIKILDSSAAGVTNTILTTCNELGLDLNKMVGQGYDGCSTFSGHISGVYKRIQQLYPRALYVHCTAHRLNLVLSESLNVTYIRKCLGTVKETK